MAMFKLSEVKPAPVTVPRLLTLVLGVIVLGLGLHSHFQSDWHKETKTGQRAYEQCDIKFTRNRLEDLGITCPRIAMEKFFVSVVIICFISSLLILICTRFVKTDFFRNIDVGYHIIGAIFLLSGGIVYIISAHQIDTLFKKSGVPKYVREHELNLYRSEKLAAGALSIINAMFYGATAAVMLIY